MNITATTTSLLQNTDFNLNVSMDVNANFVIIGQPVRATPNQELPSIYAEKIQKALRCHFFFNGTDFWR